MAFFGRGQDKRSGKVLTVGLINQVENRDPRKAQDLVSVLALAQIFEPPYAHPSTDATPEPLLFEGPLHRESADQEAPVYSAAVRRGVKFSDGSELTAADIVASLSSVEDFTESATAKAAGNRVVFELSRPNPRFELVLTQTFCSIVKESGGQRIGTGPYVVADDSTAERMRLVRNPHYREAFPIDEVVLQYFPPGEGDNHDNLIEALEKGDVDFTMSLSRDDVGKVQRVRKWFQPGNSTASLFFNTQKTHFAGAPVRKALASAIDRSALTKICYENPLAFTATSLLPPMMGSWRDAIRYSPEQAKRDLEATGVRIPPRLSMLVVWGPRPYLPQPRSVAEAIRDQLGEIGIGLDIVTSTSSGDFYERAARAENDLVLIGWIADTADPADFMESNLLSSLAPEIGKSPSIRSNMGHWKDPETDEALRRYRLDPNDVNKREILKIVRDEVPLLPLMYGPTIAVHSWRVKNFEPSPIGMPLFRKLDLG